MHRDDAQKRGVRPTQRCENKISGDQTNSDGAEVIANDVIDCHLARSQQRAGWSGDPDFEL